MENLQPGCLLKGGEYAYLHKLYHPVLGFLSGWTSFIVGFSAPIAGSAIGFSEYLFAGLDISGDNTPVVLNLIKKSVAVLIVLVFTIIHYHGIKKGSLIQNGLVVLKVLLILAIIVLGFTIGKPDLKNITSGLSSDTITDGVAFGTVMMLVMFSYSGWNASAYIAGEIKNPGKNVIRSLVMGTSIVFLLYIGINLFFLSAIPHENINDTIAIGEASATKIFGNITGNVISLIIAIMLLSSISAFIMIGPRIYYAMAKDGLFFDFAKEIHSKYEVPGRSIIIQGILAVIFVVFSTLEQLLIFLYFALNIFPFLAVLGLFIARKRNIGEGKIFKVPGYPVIPLIFLMCTFILAIMAFINRPVESSAAIIMVLLGIPIYYLWLRLKQK